MTTAAGGQQSARRTRACPALAPASTPRPRLPRRVGCSRVTSVTVANWSNANERTSGMHFGPYPHPSRLGGHGGCYGVIFQYHFFFVRPADGGSTKNSEQLRSRLALREFAVDTRGRLGGGGDSISETVRTTGTSGEGGMMCKVKRTRNGPLAAQKSHCRFRRKQSSSKTVRKSTTFLDNNLYIYMLVHFLLQLARCGLFCVFF